LHAEVRRTVPQIGATRELAYGAWTYSSAQFFLTQYRRLYPLYLLALVVAQAMALRNFGGATQVRRRPYIQPLPTRWRR
jgi:hypothetical protein